MIRPPNPGHPQLGSPTLLRWVPACVCVLLLSCSSDDSVGPFALPPDALSETAAARTGGILQIDEDALSVEEMLSDPLFQALVAGIDEPSLVQPLLAAIDALASGQTTKATNLIARASAEAIALEEGPPTEALILWSAIERFFEEAELL
jgi:hypothetical protein